jgi:hypothetical protein
MRLAGFLTPPERRKPEKHVSERHPPLLMRQGTSQQWTDTLAGSRERSNSHELSMCTQRASLYRRAVRPRRLPSPQGWARMVFEDGMWYTSQACVCEPSRQRPPCGGAEGMSWLRSPSNTCSPVMRCIRTRSCRPVQPRKYTSLAGSAQDAGHSHLISCRWQRLRPPSQPSRGGTCRHDSSASACARPKSITVELCACARAMDPSWARTERRYCKPTLLPFNTPSRWARGSHWPR